MGSGPSIDSLDDDCHDGDDDDDDGDGASECMKSELRLHKVDHRPLSTRKCKAPEAPIKQETQESLHMKAKARALHMTIQLTDFEERYQRFELIGQGGHGKVYKCKSKNAEDNKLYAVKDVDLNRLKLLPGFDKKKLRREINVLMSVQHPNIVYCWECFESKNNHFLMLLDFCDGKDLVDLVIEKRTCNQSFTEFEAKGILRQINNALGYLHANNIMHRDLKCDNIRVLNKPAVDNVKLLDFGYSKYTGTSVAKSWAGTPDYMAPEVDDVKIGQATYYDLTADCWSLGVILYVMLMMDFPRFESNDKKGFLLVNVPPSLWPMLPESQLKLMPTLSRQWEGLSAEAKDLIQGLLNKDPVARYSAKQVATHSWFKG